MRKHAQQPLKSKRKPPVFLSFVMGVMFFLILSQVVISNIFVTSGLTITELEEKTAQLMEKNERLKQKIASASSLLTIEKRAKDMGFANNPSIIAVSSNLPVALDQSR